VIRNKSNQESNPIAIQAGTSRGGWSSKLYRAVSTIRGAFSIQAWKYRWPLLFQLARETNNFRQRIRATLQSRLYRNGLDMGQQYRRDANGVLLENADIHARIEDTLNLGNQFPWLTILDMELFASGWKRGSEFQKRILDSCRSQRGEGMPYEQGDNSMPPQEVQQHSKRDL
jgi:hypothetical protein